MKIQLWSYNYDPEPTGIAPLSRVWAKAMQDRGHEVEVVAAHPHYPEPRWGSKLIPYREVRDEVPVLRLPLWAGRQTLVQRLRQEATFTAALAVTAPVLKTPDIIVAISPSFPALFPAMVNAKARRVPWLLWLQDILPDGAAASGLLDEDRAVVKLARRFERAAYNSAHEVVVISETFRENLNAKGVADGHIARIYNPASRPVRRQPRDPALVDNRLALNMGNIGHSQNLVAIVEAFERDPKLEDDEAQFVMAGDGVAGDEVRSAIKTPRTEVTGLQDDDQLSALLSRAAVGVVTQRPRDNDFNVPSKLMNFMGAGIPVVASVDPGSEVARILNESGGGWVTDSAEVTSAFTETLREAMVGVEERERRGANALRFAQENFDPAITAEKFEELMTKSVCKR